MKINSKYLSKKLSKESLKEGMSRLEIMKYNKALYSRLEKSLNNLPDGLKKYVIKYYGLPWCKNNNWLGGMSGSASNKAIYKILSLGDYTEDEIMDEMGNFIDCFVSDTDKSEDEKLKLYLNESLNEDLLDKPSDIADSICKYLDSKNFHNYELVDYDSYPMNTSKITFEVDGDWKHDHLRFKDLVYDWSFENNKNIFKIDSELVRDDGSDNYASDYFIYVTENEDSLNALKSMSKLFSESVVYPNGMPASDIDIHDALNFNFGLDRDMNDDNYTDEEKQRSIDYWIKKTDEIEEDLNLDDFTEPVDQVGKTKIYYDPNKRTYFIPSLDLDFETIDQAKDFIGAPLYTGESLDEEFITAQDVEEARRALKNPKKLSLEQVKNLQNLIKKYKEQESSRKSSKNESLNEASHKFLSYIRKNPQDYILDLVEEGSVDQYDVIFSLLRHVDNRSCLKVINELNLPSKSSTVWAIINNNSGKFLKQNYIDNPGESYHDYDFSTLSNDTGVFDDIDKANDFIDKYLNRDHDTFEAKLLDSYQDGYKEIRTESLNESSSKNIISNIESKLFSIIKKYFHDDNYSHTQGIKITESNYDLLRYTARPYSGYRGTSSELIMDDDGHSMSEFKSEVRSYLKQFGVTKIKFDTKKLKLHYGYVSGPDDFPVICLNAIYFNDINDSVDESLNEASYGGAFDIEDDMYFTRDDINEFAWEVADSLSSEFDKTFDVSDSYMETPKRLHLEVTDGDYDYSATVEIDMRKIKAPQDLMKYFENVMDQIKAQIHENEQV